MRGLQKILAPTDLSEHSRRGTSFALSLAADEKATVIVLHVANQFEAWELYSDEFIFVGQAARAWPTDRVIQEANLDLNRYLEQHIELLRRVPTVTKRIVLGPIPQRIAELALEEKADLIVMSPRRRRRLRHLVSGNITERVMRLSPCPVLSVTPPMPSPPWRGQLTPALFGWPRRKPPVFRKRAA